MNTIRRAITLGGALTATAWLGACRGPLSPASDGTTVASAPAPASTGTAAMMCVDTINQDRASLGLAGYTRWTAGEACADAQSQRDAVTGTAHGAFGQCGETTQNECEGWPGTPVTATSQCLATMWAEGPGADFAAHGHYINMSSTTYTTVACGFYTTLSGQVWSVQNFR